MSARDPSRPILIALALLALGIAAWYVADARRRTHDIEDAITVAKSFQVTPQGKTLARALEEKHGAELRWEAAPGHDGAHLPRVRAVIEVDEKPYDYRFDVDIDSGVVHPANPRARELLTASQAKE